MPYAAILFDLFDTLVRFDRERMPEIDIHGKTVRSSAGLLHAILRTQAPDVGLDRCYEALGESWREAERLRAIDHREVPAAARSLTSSGLWGWTRRRYRTDSAARSSTPTAMRSARGRVPGAPRPAPSPARRALQARGRLELRLHADGPRHPRARGSGGPVRDHRRVRRSRLAQAQT